MKGRLRFRIRVMMAERDILKATQLAELLNGVGYKISSSHLTRYLTSSPPALSLEFLSALCAALRCDWKQLFEWIDDGGVEAETPSPSDADAQAKPSPPASTRAEAEHVRETKKQERRLKLIGPQVGALPPKVRR